MSQEKSVVVSVSEEKCVICLTTIQHLAVINSCSHHFCYGCIKEWAETALRCPLCQKEFSTLQHKRLASNGSNVQFEQEVLSSPTKKLVDTAHPDLDCLSDTYFLGEIKRLQINAEKANKEIFMSRSKKRRDDYGYSRLLEVMDRLKVLESLMNSDNQFSPNETLEDLYQLDYILQVIWNGNTEELLSIPSKDTTTMQKRYGADDAYDGYEDDGGYDDYEYGDDYDDNYY